MLVYVTDVLGKVPGPYAACLELGRFPGDYHGTIGIIPVYPWLVKTEIIMVFLFPVPKVARYP